MKTLAKEKGFGYNNKRYNIHIRIESGPEGSSYKNHCLCVPFLLFEVRL